MGLATAELLASRGARISLADINEKAVESAKASLPSNEQHIWTKVDIRDTESVNSWIKRTVDHFGRIDGAVNMAGIITPARPITEQTDDDFAFSMDVNAQGVFRCLRAQLRNMKQGGSIVSARFCHRVKSTAAHRSEQVSAASTFGQFGAPGNSAYCASKAAVIALARTAAKENPAVRVNCVAPGT